MSAIYTAEGNVVEVATITSPYSGAWVDLYLRDARTKVASFSELSPEQAEALAEALLAAAALVRAWRGVAPPS